MSDSVYIQLARYSQPPLIVLGTIGALLNIVLFSYRKQLRLASCSLYFRTLALTDLLVLYIVILPAWYISQFGKNPSARYNWYCKIDTYLSDVLYALPPYFLVLACFDRLCTSSTNAQIRKIATIRIATFLIPAMTLVIFLVYFHVPIWYQIIYFPGGSVCFSLNWSYLRMNSIFLLIIVCIVPPVLMCILCCITLILLRQQRHRIMPINQARFRRRDNQLLKMLFIYVLTNILCTVPFTVTYVIFVFIPSGFTRTLLNLFLIFSLLYNLNFATSFYVYTLCTPFYRRELYNLFKSGKNKFLRAPSVS